MKIKLLVSRCGVGFVQNVGDEIDVCDSEAGRMIDAGQAEPVRQVKIEKAAKKVKAEKATK